MLFNFKFNFKKAIPVHPVKTGKTEFGKNFYWDLKIIMYKM